MTKVSGKGPTLLVLPAPAYDGSGGVAGGGGGGAPRDPGDPGTSFEAWRPLRPEDDRTVPGGWVRVKGLGCRVQS